MTEWKQFFKGKRVTVVGLGLLGKRLGDITFLSECGAEVLVTDLKSAEELALSIEKLKGYKSIKYALGGHRFEDFENRDFILKGQGTPFDSPYILHARQKGIPIEMDESLFVKLAPKAKIIGVTGTRGKSTTTLLIYEILKKSGMRVHLGGNLKGMAALPLLKEIKDGDIVVFELSSWQLQGFGEAKISPNVSVFTNFMPDHMNYYKNDMEKYFADKYFIYKFQKQSDVLVLGTSMKDRIRGPKRKIVNTDIKDIPKGWNIQLKGEHNLENIACALAVARSLNISDDTSKEAVENFKSSPGRLELVKEVNGIKIYNDTNSSTPDATTVALRALGNSVKKNIVLIMGGSDKNLSFGDLYKYIIRYVKEVVLIPGNGTDRISPDLQRLKISLRVEKDLKHVVEKAYSLSKPGDVLLFSPAFASFGMFDNEYDRGEKFLEIVKELK
ncbi:UDP-N-acetylmuramoyl-L-alanine--D-glutamate ligase [Candidatus Nomurabacteria bacterium]|nr:UDP-N-acetylmuramoyl-L-alanine--D-glutamate ligase [Candidatus Nomurabacteria bacterium]